MKDRSEPTSIEVYSAYVEYRRNGMIPEDAWGLIQPRVEQVARGDRSQLASLIKNWEAKEGSKYRLARAKNSEVQRPEPRAARSEVAAPPSTIMKPLPSGGEGVRRISVTCPNCGTVNRMGEMTCQHCGVLLKGKRGKTRRLDNRDAEQRTQLALFERGMRLVIYIRGFKDPLIIEPRGETIIGRQHPENTSQVDLDLTPYGGDEQGVSRLHAAIKHQDNTLFLTDLGSSNHSFVNGQQLHAQEARVLHDGDEVRLGNMLTKIRFKR